MDTATPDFDINYWDDKDGWVGAHVNNDTTVTIWAESETKLFAFLTWLIDEIHTREKERARRHVRGALLPKMQGQIINGELNVRFPRWPGVGMAVPGGQKVLLAWFGVLVQTTMNVQKRTLKKHVMCRAYTTPAPKDDAAICIEILDSLSDDQIFQLTKLTETKDIEAFNTLIADHVSTNRPDILQMVDERNRQRNAEQQ